MHGLKSTDRDNPKVYTDLCYNQKAYIDLYINSYVVLVIVIFINHGSRVALWQLCDGQQEFDIIHYSRRSGIFRDTDAHTYCTIRPFKDADPDIERAPLSTNRRLFDSGGIDLFGSLVVAGPTTDIIYVLVPDSTTCTAYFQQIFFILPREDLHRIFHCVRIRFARH